MPDGRPLPVWKNNAIWGWSWFDVDDWKLLRNVTLWSSDGYVFRTLYTDDGMKTTIAIHRQIMGLKNGDPLEVDHIDRDPLNNRRSNLRIVTRYQNEGNHDFSGSTSKKIGVSYDSRLNKWKAQGSLDGTYVYLGVYTSEDAAVAARRRWEEENDRVRHEEWMFTGEQGTQERSKADPSGVERDG